MHVLTTLFLQQAAVRIAKFVQQALADTPLQENLVQTTCQVAETPAAETNDMR